VESIVTRPSSEDKKKSPVFMLCAWESSITNMSVVADRKVWPPTQNVP
jgi:hypothetical protein